MNRRIVKKVLADPLGHTMPMVRRAAARERLWWFNRSQTDFWWELADLPRGPQGRRRSRRIHRAQAGRHDWAYICCDIPF